MNIYGIPDVVKHRFLQMLSHQDTVKIECIPQIIWYNTEMNMMLSIDLSSSTVPIALNDGHNEMTYLDCLWMEDEFLDAMDNIVHFRKHVDIEKIIMNELK